jgi:hypothetical protein
MRGLHLRFNVYTSVHKCTQVQVRTSVHISLLPTEHAFLARMTRSSHLAYQPDLVADTDRLAVVSTFEF